MRQMLPVQIGRALHVFVPSVRQALNISYTVATDLGHRGFWRSLTPLTQGFVGEIPKAAASARMARALDSYSSRGLTPFSRRRLLSASVRRFRAALSRWVRVRSQEPMLLRFKAERST